MSSIVINDILEELLQENKRLLKVLSYCKTCLKVLIDFKTTFDVNSNKFKQCLELNEWKKFEKLNEEIIEIVFKEPVDSDDTDNEDIVTEENVSIKTDISSNFNDEQHLDKQMDEKLSNISNDKNTLTTDRYLNTNNFQLVTESNVFDRITNIINDRLYVDFNQENSVTNSLFNESLGQNSSQNLSDETNSKTFKKSSFKEPKRFKCNICDRSFNHRSNLSFHRINVHKVKQFMKCKNKSDEKTPEVIVKCEVCERSFKDRRNLLNHLRDIHKIFQNFAKENFKCNLCDCKFGSRYDLNVHNEKKHNIELEKKCPQCSKDLQLCSNERIKIHMELHEKGVFKCWNNGCDKVFDLESKACAHLNAHRKNDDPSRKSRFACDWPGCDFRSTYKGNVEKHKTYVHKPDHISRTLECPHPGCGKKFYRNNILKNHLETHKDRPKLECDICGKFYANEYCLNVHKRDYHLKKKKFECPHSDCQYRASYLCKLRTHEKITHAINKPFVCDVNGCGKRFSTKDRLKAHNDTHQTEYKYKCTFDGCEKIFKTENNMKIHYNRQHVDRELLRCDWPGCEYQTKYKNGLKRHSFVHKTERDFICEWPECGKTYKLKRQLNEHMRVHTKDKRYVCEWPECQFRTEYSSSLHLHRRVHQK